MSDPAAVTGRLLHRRYSPERSWEPLSNDEWAVLAPFLHRAAEAEWKREAEFAAAQHPDAPAIPARRPAGRPIRTPRTRLDAIFWLAANTRPGRAPPPWAALPAHFGKPDTVSRQFRRWAKAGLWTRLLEALADPSRSSAAWKAGSTAPIAALGASWACKAWRLPGAWASFRRCAAPPGSCQTPICPNRSFPSSAPPCSAPASMASASSRPASCAVTRSCWPSPLADSPSREPWHRRDGEVSTYPYASIEPLGHRPNP
jgi:transposase